tara:strand:- start:591 stop:827 length:237 start_codon:yes stop_codon:yes gene_type:complete
MMGYSPVRNLETLFEMPNFFYLYIPIIILATILKAFALWISARRGEKFWFVFFILVNLFGVPEAIYIYLKKRRSNKDD